MDRADLSCSIYCNCCGNQICILGSMTVVTIYLISVIVYVQHGGFGVENVSYLHEMYGVAAFLMILAFWRHRANIKRLLSGTENKISVGGKDKNKSGMTDKKKGQAMANVSVIGAGSWGTALALLLCKNGHDVTVWSYKEEEVRTLSEKREHVSKLPGVKIPNEIFFTADLKEAVEGKDVVVLAVPSIHVRNTAKKMKHM